MIIFENLGEIDARSISSFGVSVKDSDNPIGFFGTGLKYAIAVLLRTGHDVTIYSGLSIIRLGVKSEQVRGQDFDFVTMAIDGGAPVGIGFTTQLGKLWQVWMAYREIACNCKDEGGSIASAQAEPAPEAGITKIIVNGAPFAEAYADRASVILEDEPFLTVGTTEIRNRPGEDFFYRGVRVHQHNARGLFTYNDTGALELTEDRTCKDHWQPRVRIIRAILRADDDAFIRACVTAPEHTLEKDLDFHGWGITPSKAFLAVVGDCMSDRLTKVNRTAEKVWSDATQQAYSPREVVMTKVQHASMERALDFCAGIGFQIRGSYPIKVVESLGSGTLGLAKDQTIFIAERVFQIGGTKQLAATLIEEYLHLRHGWADLTRELQSFLFEKLVSIGEELVGEPL